MKVYKCIKLGDFSFQDLAELTDFAEWENMFVIVAKLPKKRSVSQNRYYWGVVLTMLSEHTGYTKDQMHEICKMKFNLKTKALKGEIYEFGGPTKELDTKEMTDYIESIREWSMEVLQCRIPQPDEIPLEYYAQARML